MLEVEQVRRDVAAASFRAVMLTAQEQPWLFHPKTKLDTAYLDRNEVR